MMNARGLIFVRMALVLLALVPSRPLHAGVILPPADPDPAILSHVFGSDRLQIGHIPLLATAGQVRAAVGAPYEMESNATNRETWRYRSAGLTLDLERSIPSGDLVVVRVVGASLQRDGVTILESGAPLQRALSILGPMTARNSARNEMGTFVWYRLTVRPVRTWHGQYGSQALVNFVERDGRLGFLELSLHRKAQASSGVNSPAGSR